MGYADVSKLALPAKVKVDGLGVQVLAKNSQKARPLGRILRATMHWTGGNYVTAYDDYHYCIVFDAGKRKAHVLKTLKLTQLGEHARLANSHNVGVSFCGMYGAARAGDLGPMPITPEMLRAGAVFVAEFCAWHRLDPDGHGLTDHRAVDEEIGRDEKWDIEPYWEAFRAAVIEHHAALKAGRAKFQYRGILTD